MTDPAFPAFEYIPGRLDAGVLFVCDHARNALPPQYGDLGLPPEAFGRHIAYDIGAADVTRHWARTFQAPAVLSTFSRLLIDPNRGADDPTLVMKISDGAIIPGNAGADEAEIARRVTLYWKPYRDKIAETLDAILATGTVPAIISMHSFTPFWKSTPRPWHVGVLWDNDPRIPVPFIEALRAGADIATGDNEPYDGALEGDVIDIMATRRGLANILIEIRQDLLATQAGAAKWAERLQPALRQVLSLPEAHEMKQFGSRTRPGQR